MTHSTHKIVSYKDLQFKENVTKIPELTDRVRKRSEYLKLNKEKIRTISLDDITRVKEMADNLIDQVGSVMKEDFDMFKLQAERGNHVYDKLIQEQISIDEMLKVKKKAIDGNKNCCNRYVSYCHKYDKDGKLLKPDNVLQTLSLVFGHEQDMVNLF